MIPVFTPDYPPRGRDAERRLSAAGKPVALTPKVFDTWSNLSSTWFDYSNWNLPGLTSSIPMKVQVQAVQITLRVWDHKAQRTRQVTLIQGM